MSCAFHLYIHLDYVACMEVESDFALSAGRLPTLELYSTLRRTAHKNESIIEQSVDGMDLAAAAYFRCVRTAS